MLHDLGVHAVQVPHDTSGHANAAIDRKASQSKDVSRRTSEKLRSNSTALPGSSKPNLPKAPASLASRSLSDTSEGKSALLHLGATLLVPLLSYAAQ